MFKIYIIDHFYQLHFSGIRKKLTLNVFQFSTMDTLLGKIWIFALDGWHFSIRVPRNGF